MTVMSAMTNPDGSCGLCAWCRWRKHRTGNVCGCGDPGRASFYWHAVIGTSLLNGAGTETNYVDGYSCADHNRAADEIQAEFDSGRRGGWQCLAVEVFKLPGDRDSKCARLARVGCDHETPCNAAVLAAQGTS